MKLEVGILLPLKEENTIPITLESMVAKAPIAPLLTLNLALS